MTKEQKQNGDAAGRRLAQSVLPYQAATISATARKADKISEKCKATGREGVEAGRDTESDLRIARDILIKILTAQATDRKRDIERVGKRGEKDENEKRSVKMRNEL